MPTNDFELTVPDLYYQPDEELAIVFSGKNDKYSPFSQLKGAVVEPEIVINLNEKVDITKLQNSKSERCIANISFPEELLIISDK